MYEANITSLTQPIPNGSINLTCTIGSTDDCVAAFTLTFNGSAGVTDKALRVDAPEEKEDWSDKRASMSGLYRGASMVQHGTYSEHAVYTGWGTADTNAL
ncbi:hypothetical protein FPHYL_7221 [Fusarium phyllophilum]|uniref:Uncharacterized protein n=1 Tax=Fusarium phyllophilum TaxID=47803 RepID=A0A8H5NBN9_9HYPO|nr:hypothetical protein FPHYL_7221 [Fusarium phyllophilum]